MGRARSKKNSIFPVLGYRSSILRTAYRKQFYPEPMVPTESRDSEGVPFASHGESDQAFGRYWPVKGGEKSSHVTITKIENLHIDTLRKIH